MKSIRNTLMLLALTALSACSTLDGIGKDIQDFGRWLGL